MRGHHDLLIIILLVHTLEVHKYDAIAVGGSAHTVSPGGYTLGGGHSPLTRMFGLGVDSVLEFTMVTANGSIVTITENGKW